MKSQLVIIGAGGHGKVCREVAELNGYKKIIVLDDAVSSDIVYGNTDCIPQFVENSDFFVAIGNNTVRKMFMDKIAALRGTMATLIHPRAVVSASCTIGDGSVVMAGAVINADAVMERGVIVNTCSSVDHDCRVGEASHIAVGAHLAGTVKIGKLVTVGAGATVIHNISVADRVMLGAGAVVISDIPEAGTYVGVPAKRIK